MRGQQVRRNRDLNIQCSVSFIDAYKGKQLEANYRLPSGRNQNVVINVPPGVSHGDTIRYPGLGDDSIPGAPRGNLNVTVLVQPDPNYERRGDDLYYTVEISPIEAMVGTKKKVKNLDDMSLDLDIRPGIEHGAEFASNGTGFPNVNTGYKGRFVSVIKIKPFAVTDATLVQQLKDIDVRINQRT
jgi:DnaJ-class molecular chaperone